MLMNSKFKYTVFKSWIELLKICMYFTLSHIVGKNGMFSPPSLSVSSYLIYLQMIKVGYLCLLEVLTQVAMLDTGGMC